MSKAAEAFRTISEVADELDVQKHVLRFWEARFPQVRPMKRGGGRRYYRPEDMELLRGIRHLLHAEGYTIKGVQKILREQGIDHVKQYGRVPDEAEVAAAAGRGKRGRADQRALSPSGPASAPQSSRSPTEIAAAIVGRGGAGRMPSSPAEQLALVQAAIRELEECRSMLLETLGEKSSSQKSVTGKSVGSKQAGKDASVAAPATRRARAVGA